jgi:type II secretory pathway pseudopilin PulG
MSIKKYFTIIELLITFAILAVLISLIGPSLNKMRTHAYTVHCTKNLKLITYATDHYLLDHSNKYIHEGYNFDGRRYYRYGTFVTERFGNYQVTYDSEYLENKSAFHCPSSFRQNATGSYNYGEAEAFAYDYAMNTSLYNRSNSDIKTSLNKVMTNTDTNYEWMHSGVHWRIDVRHGMNLNHLWADGHVSTSHYLDFQNNFQWVGFWNQTPRVWTGDFTLRDN